VRAERKNLTLFVTAFRRVANNLPAAVYLPQVLASRSKSPEKIPPRGLLTNERNAGTMLATG
jgi:hypothetical protein